MVCVLSLLCWDDTYERTHFHERMSLFSGCAVFSDVGNEVGYGFCMSSDEQDM